MKFLPFALLFLAVPVLAQSYAPFTGKFTVDSSSCNSVSFMGMKRVYVYLARDFDRTPILRIDSYGGDAGILTVLLGKGTRPTPGTDPAVHGKVTDTWTTTVNGNVLEMRGKTERPSQNLRYSWRTVLRSNSKSLSWRQETLDATGEVTDVETCRLIRP